jgi:alkyl hydroperoxide reductase subunit AhpC
MGECVNNLDVGRNIDETLRVLEALQTGELCPCNWKEGDATLKVVGGSLVEA